jgi:superfamily II DNA or RNA helicase
MSAIWPHQTKALSLVTEEFRKGNNAVCLVMSTGAGKTFTGGFMASRVIAKKPGSTVLWCAHREELVSQAYDELSAQGLSCGVIQANPTRECNPYRPVQIASTQTLLARGLFPSASFLVLDEVHHYASTRWSTLGAEYKKRGVYLVGLTATPIRADGRGLEDLFDSLVCPISMKDLIAQGFLVPYTLIAPERPLRNDQIAARPVDAYLTHAAGRKAIVFAAHIKAAAEFLEQFKAAGVAAGMVTGEMHPSERRATLDAYKSGRLTVLCNVGVLTEGFDDRPTSCVILARSVGSVSLYLQICGRALRTSPKSGKADAILIDLHGSCRIHGLPDDDREFSLEGDGVVRNNLEKAPERFCPVCGVLLEGDATVCDLCGIAKAEMVPPEVVNTKLVKYAAKLREPEKVRKAYFEKLKAIARANSYKPFQPIAKYKAIYGEAPPRAWGWW